MLQVPKWKSNLRIETLKPDLVFALSEGGHSVLKGHAYYQVAPHINGANDITEIAQQISDLPFMQVHYTINRLHDKGFVVETGSQLPTELENFCHAFAIPTKKAGERLQNTSLHVMSVGGSSTTFLQEGLSANHVKLTNKVQNADLCLVVTPEYLHPEIEPIHHRFTQSGQAWMLIKPDSIVPWIGPLFDGRLSGCWACLEQRLRLHRRLEKTISIQRQTSEVYTPPTLQLPAISGVVANLVTIEVLKWILAGKNEDIQNHVIALHTINLEVEKHRFTKRPQCPVCGDPEIIKKRALRPIELQSQPKKFTADGGHRTKTPEQTVAQYLHHVSRVTGVVSGLVKQPANSGGEGLIHTYLSGVNLKYNSSSYEGLRSLYRGGDGGKGATDIQSQASAICEAIERYSGSYHGDEYVIYATYEELGDKAIHPYKCLNFSEAQYENATATNRVTKTSIYNRVRPRFSEKEAVAWTPVWSLTHQTTKYLPTAFLYFGSLKTNEVSSTPACSNGLAAGNTLEEAILQGFMELVERDSVSIWWYNRIRRPAVDLHSFPNPYIHQLVDYYNSIGRELWALDVTNDLGIPTFAAVSRDIEGPREDLVFGFGAHFDPQIALLRALTETNQGISAFLQADGEIPDFNEEGTAWWSEATLENQPYMAPDPILPPRRLQDFEQRWHDDIRDDVQLCVNIAAQNGLETLVIDQTQPDVGLNVVKVIVPGLRHFWRRLAPGRLYDVPVKMGWRKRPLKEEELNPYSIFI